VRDKKPIAVARVRSGGAEVEIFYDFRERDFFFEAPGTRSRVHASTFIEVRRQIDVVYEKATPLAWTPVILVTLHDAYDERDHSVRSKSEEGASVSLTFRRCELSPRPDHAEVVERVTRVRAPLPIENWAKKPLGVERRVPDETTGERAGVMASPPFRWERKCEYSRLESVRR